MFGRDVGRTEERRWTRARGGAAIAVRANAATREAHASPGRGRDRRVDTKVALALALIALTTAPAIAGGPTDIRKVDEFIDAPRILFGDSLPDVLRILGPPSAQGTRTRETFREPVATRAVERLTYPGLWLDLRERLVGVEITAPARRLPWGLEVGASRATVQTILGAPQEETDDRALYLYSDGFPKTVTFHFRDGRVWRINWEYWVE